MTTAADLLETLRAWDVPFVFCCPGTTEIPLLDALSEPEHQGKAPEFLLTTHEAIAVSMADGYARASGQVAVAYLHTNVGLANGLAHLYAAQVARSGVVLLTGIKGTSTLPHRALTTSPRLLETAAPYAGYVWQNLSGDDLVDDIDRALWRSQVPPESPSVLTIPQDHFTQEPSKRSSRGRMTAPRQRPDAGDLERAASLLKSARRLIIVAGSDVARRNAEPYLERIAVALNAPVFVESRRDLERWSFPSDHPCFVGLFEAGSPASLNADLLFLVGTPTPLEFSSEVPILPLGVPVVHLSEDSAEPGMRAPVAIGLAGDTELALAELASLLEGSDTMSHSHLEEVRAAHASQLQAWRDEIPTGGESEDFSAAVAMRVLAEHLGGNGILVLDAVTSTLPLLRFIERPTRDTLFATASGSLGWAMGAAPGIALARGERVAAVVGDGVLQFGVPAFWTVRHYNLPVTYVVVNNGKYQAMVSGLTRMNGKAHAKRSYPLTDISGVDIAGVAESFGIPATRVTNAADLARAVDADLARTPQDGPHLIEVKVNDVLWP